MITRGGYGLSRILPRLPYKKIAKAIKSGTNFVGLSDFTAFQMALFAKTGASTWAGPTLLADFGSEQGLNDVTQLCFEDMVSGRGEGAGWQIKTKTAKNLFTKALLGRQSISIEDTILWGGNLSMVCALLGTPYFPDIDGGILFLEDVGEHPYRLERMLIQLLQSGVLAKQKAVIMGSFSEFKLTKHDKGFNLKSVHEFLSTQLRIPIICDLPFGHVPLKLCLPFGERVTFATEGQEAFLFWKQHHHEHGSH
jgi:muramoyltetrapeptide carboxypeptidase